VGHTWPDVLTGLIAGDDLSADAVGWAMDEILAGNATPVQWAGFLVALRAKGETVDEIAGLAGGMLARATPISLPAEAVDVVGSGGDRANTVNVSTMAAIVAAGAGVKVVKHGNRAASSACGAADVLEALGVALDVPPERQAAVLAEAGIVFLFAPMYHPSLRHAGTARRELGIQTPFNFLGPLANPARPAAQAVGIANARMAEIVAGVLAGRGTRGLVFHGDDGLDELTTTTTSDVWLIADRRVQPSTLDPGDLGVAPASRDDLLGGDAAHNAAIVRGVLDGAKGAVRDIVLLNAAAALLAFAGPDLDRDVTPQLADQLQVAARAIDSGAAAEVLSRWVTASQRAAQSS
jgi:anthranilate phosphoribosyltransferase